MRFAPLFVPYSLAFALLGPAITTRAEASDVVKKTFAATAIKELDLETASGDVTIKGGAAEAGVVATKRKFDQGCELKIELSGTTLVVENDKDGSDRDCEVDLEITLPRAVALDLEIGAGDVDVAGVEGAVEFKLGAGDLTITDSVLKDIDGKSGSGDVTVTATIGKGELKIGAGNATINYASAPTQGSLDVRLGTGNATVGLPKDARVKTTFKSAMGSLTNEIDDAPNASYTISGSAGVGDLTIKRL
jgi:DUF4097 and DUF4098 domain-containing protein YvlB